MRRLIPLLTLTVALTACGGSDNNTAQSTMPSTTAPTTTTSTTSTTTTTAAVIVPEEVVPIGAAVASLEPLPGTAPAVFDTFASSVGIVMGLGNIEITATGAGLWTADAIECSMTMGIGGFGAKQTVIATPDQLWLDTGAGFEEAGLLGTVQDVLSTCPSAPAFWRDFDSETTGRATGETEDFYGRRAIRMDLTELTALARGMGAFTDLGDADVETMVMWVDAETSVPIGYLAEVELDPASVANLGLPGEELPDRITMKMDLHIERINDPSVTVALPTG